MPCAGYSSNTMVCRYEDPNHPYALTGGGLNNERYSWFEYDSEGRAIESRHANDINKTQFAYGTTTTTVTNALGHETLYTYSNADKTRLVGIAAVGTPYCAKWD